MTRFAMTLRMTLTLLMLQSLALATTPPLSDLDLNNDGYVNGADAVLLLEGISAHERPGAADLDKNSLLDHRDLSLFLQAIGRVGWGAPVRPIGEGWTETIDGWILTPQNPDEQGGWDWCFIPDPYGGGYDWCEGGGGGDDDGGGPGDFEPPDDGGGGGDDDDGGGSGCACECGDIELRGPNYVGVGQSFSVNLFRFGGACRGDRGSGRLVVTSGHGLLERPGLAGMSPGTVTYRSYFTLCNGDIVCSDTHTVRIRDYWEFDVRYAMFITCEAVKTPDAAFWEEPYFGGDDRWFNPNSTAYRSVHQRRIDLRDLPIVGPVPSPYDPAADITANDLVPFGVTTAYDEQGAEEVAGYCDVALLGPPPINWGMAEASCFSTVEGFFGSHCMSIRRVGTNQALVHFYLHAGDPLVFAACTVDTHFTMLLTQHVDSESGDQTLDVAFFGRRDNYPAHEVYVNEHRIYGFDPAAPPTYGVMALCALTPTTIVPVYTTISLP